jgi:PAS domain-containing protein
METSVPRQRDASDSALVDMLMVGAPAGLALFGPDLRFRWVNAALMQLGADPGDAPSGDPRGAVSAIADPPDVDPDAADSRGPDSRGPGPAADPASYVGRLPSEVWPAEIAARAEGALRAVLAQRAPLTESGYPLVPAPIAGGTDATPGASAPAEASGSAADVSGCASWFPVRDAAGDIIGIGLILLNVAAPGAAAAAAARAAEADLRRSEERYRSLVQGGAQVVWVASPDGGM